MRTSCTSSEEGNSPYLRKFGHNIKNNDEGRKLSVVVRTSFPGSWLRQFFPTSPPTELVFQSIEETLLQPVLKSFITVVIQYNEGLENKLTRPPLFGLAKSIYWRVPNEVSSSTFAFFVLQKELGHLSVL